MEELIRKEIFKYGFLPLLIVLERFECIDEYEVCQSIINTINTHSKEFDLELPTKLSGEAVAQYKLAFMTHFNLNGNIAYANSEWYADEIAKSIQNFKNTKFQKTTQV